MTATELERFAAAVDRDDDDIELDVAALLIGAWERVEFDVATYRRRLDDIAAHGRTRGRAPAGQTEAAIRTAARALATMLFADLGFRGNSDNYYNPRNSFLGDVLDRRIGIPITLSVLFIEVARRLGLPASGIGFPGHFLVRVDAGGGAPLILDPFHGGAVLGRPELESLLAQSVGPDARLEETSLEAASKRAILARMLANLAGIYGRAGDVRRSLEILERQALLDPSNPRIAASLAQVRRRHTSLN